MKNFIKIALLLFSLSVVFSCKKSQVAQPSIVGRWSLVSDYYSSFVFSTGQPDTSKYFGVSTDYFYFEANGNLSWYEKNSGSDSASYKLGTGSQYNLPPGPQINIYWYPASAYYPNTPEAQTFNVTFLSAHSLILNTGTNTTPEGPISEVMTLSR